jgi:BirA family biotin operon repressor/biotin-[acetyl-CoA-carboxylase] ligase
LRIWGESGVNSLADIYLKYSDTIGKEVRVELGSGNTISAIAVGLSELGELKLSNGSTVSIGDVTHLR